MHNLSELLEARHSTFHRAFGQNYTVDEITRRVIYDSLGIDSVHAIPVEPADKVLHVVTMSNWSCLYKPAATLSIANPSALAKADEFRELTHKYLEEEQKWIHARLAMIAAQDPIPISSFLKAFLEFFDHNDSPVAALGRLYTETHDGGVSWVKAMCRVTRNAVLQYLRDAEVADISRGSRAQILTVLNMQNKHIRKNLKEWS